MNFPKYFRAAARLSAIAVILALSPGPARADGEMSLRVAVEEAMRRSNGHYLATFPLGTAVWNRGAYQTGNFRAWQTLGVQAYHDHAVAWATVNSWLIGPDAADADRQACGQTYIDLYRIDPQPVRIASIKSRMDALVASSSSEDDWWWIDAFFMAGPTFARLGVLQSNPAYFVQLEKMYLHMKNNRGLFSPTNGLWYRDASAKSHKGANTPEFWGRGNGWVIAACARVLEELPAGDPRRPEFAGMLQTMAAALRPLQGADGFWRSNLKFPNHYSNPETSSTAFFTYAIAYGINAGLLDSATYTPVVINAWNGLVATALHPDGKLGYVQAIGLAPGGSDYNAQQDYGYGAFLLAGSEILRLLGGPPPVFPDAGFDLAKTDTNADFVEPVILDASRTMLRSGSVIRYSWWLGTTYLGAGLQLAVDFPRGSHAATLKVEHSGGTTFTDAASVTVNPLPVGPSDSDNNGLPDAWEIHRFGSIGQNPAADPNGDGLSLLNEYILGGNPNLLQPGRDDAGKPVLVLDARAAFGPGYTGKIRKFRLLTNATLDAGGWQAVPGYEAVTGDNLPRSTAVPEAEERRFYKVAAWLE